MRPPSTQWESRIELGRLIQLVMESQIPPVDGDSNVGKKSGGQKMRLELIC